MTGHPTFRSSLLGAVLSVCLLSSSASRAQTAATAEHFLAGTWTLMAADVVHPDGSRDRDYGANPKGLLFIDAQGHYSLQIFKSERQPFKTDDKSHATAAEYKSAVMGSSTHFGTLSVDQTSKTLTFHIENASFPNWEGTQQTRHFDYSNGELSYRVTPRPNGDVPISVWRRLENASQAN